MRAPLGDDREPPIRPRTWLRNDPLGNFLLEHKSEARPEGWPLLDRQPLDEERGSNIVRKVRRHTNRCENVAFFEKGAFVSLERIVRHHSQSIVEMPRDIGQSI